MSLKPVIAALLLGASLQASVQEPADLAAKRPKLCLETTAKQFGWSEPAEPMKVVGPVYFVGTRGLSVWLITTSKGHILLNTALPGSGPMIAASIHKLGFKPEDVKLLLACGAHVDHAGGHAYIKRLTGAQVVMLDAAAALLRSGGKDDLGDGNLPELWFEPVKVDLVIRDQDSVRLGDVALKAYRTPGHPRGSTTWVTEVAEGGKAYKVVFPDGTGAKAWVAPEGLPERVPPSVKNSRPQRPKIDREPTT